MYTIDGYLYEPKYVDINGKAITRTPQSHPYTYDEFVQWKETSFEKRKSSVLYSDRLYQWDYKKYNECCNKVFGNEGQYFYSRIPEDIEKFLSLYLNESIKLTAIIQGCNPHNGYPYWVFYYKSLRKD